MLSPDQIAESGAAPANCRPPAAAYDCVVIGGGPAGCTVATLVAQAGYRTLLVEREAVPRFHIGESLMPDTYFPLQRLGVWQRLEDAGFVKKYSVQFVSQTGRESQPFYFTEHDPRPCAQTWQVERGPFDQILFENAAEKGADCRDRTRVLDVLFDGDRAAGVRLQLADGTVVETAARVVVDATGQQSLLANRLRLREDDPGLRKAAIWTYYRGAEREPGQAGGATIVLHTVTKKAWFWYIPLRGDITSVGVVADRDYLLRGRGKPEEAFAQERALCPALQRRLEGAEQVGRIHVAKEYTYVTTQSAGDGWVLAGDAFGFIDPIYSSGVYFALKSGELAADAIVDGLRRGDTSAAQLGRWCDEFRAGVRWIRKLVDAFYDDDFSIGQFMKQYPEHKGNLTDLLIGRVFYPGAGAIFRDMDPWIEQIRRQRLGAAPAGGSPPLPEACAARGSRKGSP